VRSREYGSDVFGPRPRAVVPTVPAELGLVVEEVTTGWCGAVVECDKERVSLEDRRGVVRVFPLDPAGFLLDGKTVTLTRPTTAAPAASRRTASGSVAVVGQRARVARGSRLWVEGKHDAELVERVWGDDLRVEGVVVEYLEGIDDLSAQLSDFRPGPERRAGVLVDHLVPGSKESRIAGEVARSPLGKHVLVVGHPYVDVWQAVKPERLGLRTWPQVPRSVEWKHGVCQTLGWPHRDQGDTARAWKRILGTVRTYADLEPAFLGRVEELIDFVTVG
jgi:hypothetical protein